MSYPIGSFFYSFHHDEDNLYYAGDHLIGLVLHNEEVDGTARFAVLQSRYMFSFLHASLPDTPGYRNVHTGVVYARNYEMTISDFQKDIRDFLKHPTLEKSNALEKNYSNLIHEESGSFKNTSLLEMTPTAFDSAIAHQKSIMEISDEEYMTEVLTRHLDDHSVKVGSRIFNFYDFKKAYFLGNDFKHIPPNIQPF